MAGGALGAAPRRAACRASLRLPLRKPTLRTPKVHPATGMPLSKAKGQHLIHNIGVVQKMIEAADLRTADAVYEVGCGTGELTMRVLPLVRKVHTVDVERRMVQETQHRAQASDFQNLEAAVGDALRLPLPRRFDVCLSNLPYQISSPFIFKLMRRLSDGPPWRAAVLMVQREFAERLLADPGEQPFSRLALNARLFVRATRVFDVRPGSFVPAPQVHSTVLRLEPRLPAPRVDFAEWDAMVRVVFSRRRKTLRAQFSKISTVSMLEYNHKVWCSLAGQRPSTRPFPELVMSVLEEEGCLYERAYAMDIDDLHSLLEAFHRKGIRFVNVQGACGADGQLLAGGPGGGGADSDGEDSDGPLPRVGADGMSALYARQAAPSPGMAAAGRPPPPPPRGALAPRPLSPGAAPVPSAGEGTAATLSYP